MEKSVATAQSIVDNIIGFARLLRAAGLQIGSNRILDAVNAAKIVGIANRTQFYWALHTALVTRPAERKIFDRAFAIFWRNPALLTRMATLTMPQTASPPQPGPKQDLAHRLADALRAPAKTNASILTANSQQHALSAQKIEAFIFAGALSAPTEHALKPQSEELQAQAFESFSAGETLRKKDFAQMNAAELALARTEILRIRIVCEKLRTRRYRPSPAGRKIDVRAVLRNTALKGPDYLLPLRKAHRLRQPPLVVLCDISGSMDRYAHIFLHFLYALQNNRDRISCFLFATRLHNVTRMLQNRAPDTAIASVGASITDWAGGTRLGQCLADFNRHWARRVLGRNAHVLLFTDGLDRDAGVGMERAVRRLCASCRRLIWVNPLLRYDKYRPIASGARILDRHAHATRSCHNIESLADLAIALNANTARCDARAINTLKPANGLKHNRKHSEPVLACLRVPAKINAAVF